MELDEVIKGRMSIRKYKEIVPDIELIRKCIEAAVYAPSAMNAESWRFYIVKNKKKIEALSGTQKYSEFLKDAPYVIVIAMREGESHFLEDAACAAMILMLKAHELGLGTCWNAIYHPDSTYREQYVRDILNIPKKYRVVCSIGIGYPSEKIKKRTVKKFEQVAEVIS